jgi:hypothetical protein
MEFAKSLARHFRLLCEALGGPEAVAQLPVLDLGGRTTFTGYIDFLTPADLTAPVMIGVDASDRAFVAIAIKVEDGEESDEFVLTLFQRYVGNEEEWACGATKLHIRACWQLAPGSGRVSGPPESIERVAQLLTQGRVRTDEYLFSLKM